MAFVGDSALCVSRINILSLREYTSAVTHSNDGDFPHSQTPLRLLSSAACCQPQRDSWSLWTAPSAITAPPDLLPCSGAGREEPSWTALSQGRYRHSTQSPTDQCYWPLCPLLCLTRWNPGSNVKSVTQEPKHWPFRRICMWHVSIVFTTRPIVVFLGSVYTKTFCVFLILHSFPKRCNGSGPVLDSAGGGQRLVGLLM